MYNNFQASWQFVYVKKTSFTFFNFICWLNNIFSKVFQTLVIAFNLNQIGWALNVSCSVLKLFYMSPWHMHIASQSTNPVSSPLPGWLMWKYTHTSTNGSCTYTRFGVYSHITYYSGYCIQETLNSAATWHRKRKRKKTEENQKEEKRTQTFSLPLYKNSVATKV